MPMRSFSREQAWLMPPTLDDLVPEDHPLRFAAAFVDVLDAEAWEELEFDLQDDPRGAGACHPRALLGVWIYGFMAGVRSCRKLEPAFRDQVPYTWLTGMHKPDHNTLWRFYKAHRDRMRTLLRQHRPHRRESRPCGVGHPGGRRYPNRGQRPVGRLPTFVRGRGRRGYVDHCRGCDLQLRRPSPAGAECNPTATRC